MWIGIQFGLVWFLQKKHLISFAWFVQHECSLRLPLNDQSAITRHVYLPISRTYLQKMIFAPLLLPFRGFISPWGNITRVQRWNCNKIYETIGWLLTYHLFLLIHSLPLEGKTWIKLVIENPFVRFSCDFWTLKIHKYQFCWYWGCLLRRRGVRVFEGGTSPFYGIALSLDAVQNLVQTQMTGLPPPSSIISSKHRNKGAQLFNFLLHHLFKKLSVSNYPFGKRIDWSSVSSKLYELCIEW